MKKILIHIINFYKKSISPFFYSKGIRCKYYPTCSEYSKQAIEKYGVIKGSFLSIKRFIKCNPFSKGGYDPLKWVGRREDVSIFCKHFWLFTRINK